MERPVDSVRVMTLNLWHEPLERKARHRLAGELAHELEVDILLVQEVADAPLADTLELVAGHSGLQIAAGGMPGPACRTAVLSRLPFRAEPPIRYTVPESAFDQLAAVATITSPNGHDIVAASAHLLWGGWHEHRRILQADALDRALTTYCNEGCTAVLGGDFNARPDSDTMRFLRGQGTYADRTAQWTDAFERAGRGDGTTSSGANMWARTTAEAHGFLDPSALPERRIDYILVHGYRHGRVLTPLQAFTVDEEAMAALLTGSEFPPSDHRPVVADLWDPPASRKANVS